MPTPPLPAAPRRVAQLKRAPLLAALQIRGTVAKPRGAARIWHKMVKGSYRLLHQRLGLPAEGEIVIDPAGIKRRFAADFANTAYIDYANRLGDGGYEPEMTALFERLAPALGTVYDIGANWGYFVALLMSNAAFRGGIEAFEIAPRTARDLARLVADCGFAARVRCHPFGLSDASGSVRIEEGMHSALTRISTNGHGAMARVERLDALDLPDPTLIKIDVEGHEAAVLRGGRALIARAKTLIVFESWHRPLDQAAMMEPLRLLAELGYRFFRLAWRDAALSLAPLAMEERAQIAEALNILALQPQNAAAARALALD